MEDFTKTYNVCTNRGNKRIWIEGKVLHNLGVERGTRFSRIMPTASLTYVSCKNGTSKPVNRTSICLSFAESDNHPNHTVAGTSERPIIDLNGGYLTEFFGDCEKYSALFKKAEGNYPAKIYIRGEAN